MTSKNVNEYIARFPKEHQVMLKQIRTAIRSAAPKAVEKMSYNMPFYEYRSPGYKGRLTYFGAFRNHVGIYAWGKAVDSVPGIEKYKTSKGTLQFPIGTKIPLALVKKAVKARMKEIDATLDGKKT